MLNVEILEPRCLLSVFITDSYDIHDDQFVEFPDTERGTTFIADDYYFRIFNDSLDPIIIDDLSNTRTFKMIPPDNTPIIIEPQHNVKVKLAFTPWDANSFEKMFPIKYFDGTQEDTVYITLRGSGIDNPSYDPTKLGDLTMTDLAITSSDDDPQFITSGESLGISVTVENTGTDNILVDSQLALTFSKDPEGLYSPLVITDTLFFGPLDIDASQTININLLPEDIVDIIGNVGNYHIIANVDPRWQIPEYDEKFSSNKNNDDDNFKASSLLYFDIDFDLTDSRGPSRDTLIDFHSTDQTGVGRVYNRFVPEYPEYNTEYITLTNLRNESIEITKIDTPGNNFTREMPPGLNRHGAMWDFDRNEAEAIGLDEVISASITSGAGDIDVYYFEAEQGSYIEVYIQTDQEKYVDGDVRVYSSHGDQILDPLDLGLRFDAPSNLVTLEFPAFYTDGYYLELRGIALGEEVDYQLLVTAGENLLPALQLTQAGDSYFQSLVGNNLLTPKLMRLQFGADYGDEVEIELQTTSEIDTGLGLGLITPRLYNEHGTSIPLTLSEEDEFPAPGVNLEKYEFTSLNEGTFYLYLEYILGFEEEVDFECTIRETGVFGEIEPGAKVTVPVWFTPQQTGDNLEGELILTIDTGAAQSEVVTLDLLGEGLTGDFGVDEVKPLGLVFPNLVMSGTSLPVSATIINHGPGDMSEAPQVQFVLSTDWIFGDEDDSEAITVELYPLDWGERVTVSAEIDVPENFHRIYWLLAAVDPGQSIPEYSIDPGDDGYHTNQGASQYLWVSPGKMVIVDSEGFEYDSAINFGPTQLGSYSVEVVSLHNRSSQPVTVTGVELASDDPFEPFGLEEGSPTAGQFVIMPGHVEHVPVVFAPKAFPFDGDSIVGSTLVFSTDEFLDYSVDLYGTLQGPDLVVTAGEEEGDMAEVIDELDFDVVSVEDTSGGIAITLRNLGTESLTVSALVFANGANSAFHFVEHQIELSDQTIVDIPIPEAPFQLSSYGSTDDKGEKIYEKTVALAFTPYSPSQFLDTLIIRSDMVADDYSVRLSGQGKAPLLKVYDYDMNGNPMGETSDDKFLPFGWHEVDKSAQAIIRLVNEGNDDLVIQGWYLANANQDDFSIDIQNDLNDRKNDILLLPGASFDLTITFEAPGDGLFSDILIVHSNDGNRAIELSSLSGQAAYPSLEIYSANEPIISGATLDLGKVPEGETETRWLRIKNAGLVEMQLESSDNVYTNDFIIEGNGFSFAFASSAQHELNEQGYLDLESAGESFLLSIRFDASGDYDQTDFDGTFKVRYLPESFPDRYYTVNLTASIITPGIITEAPVFPALYPARGSGTAIITNTGTADLVIRQWYTNNPQFEVQIPSGKLNKYGQLVIAPDQSTSVTLFCQPEHLIDDEGRLIPYATGILTLATSGLNDQELTKVIDLKATVLPEEIDLLPGSPVSFRDYENQLVTVSIAHGEASFTLINGGRGGHYIDDLELLKSSDKTKLNISVRGGETYVGTIISSESLGSIKAPKVIMNEGINIKGSLTQLLLGDISEGVAINVAMASEKSMKVKAGNIGNNVSLNFAGDLKIFEAHSFPDGTLEAEDINKLKITKGDLGTQVTAQQINRINVRRDITGGIYAQDAINSIVTKKGTLSAELRGNTINSIKAYALNEALISARHIGKVRISTDAVDSYLLAGFDIGMKGLRDPTDDYLYEGRLDLFRFGGELRNTFVASGVMPERIYESLNLPLAAGSETSTGTGSIGNIKGKTVHTESGLAEFGFYAADSIKTNLIPLPPNFVIMENQKPNSI